MRGAAGLLLLCLAAVPALAGSPIPVGTDTLFGARLGMSEAEAVPILTAELGPGEDTGWIEGCPLDGIDVRWLGWGGLTAQFEETDDDGRVFSRWTFGLDRQTGEAIPGGPVPERIVLPGGVRMGDRFSAAATAWGFEPKVDDVFGIAYHFAEAAAGTFAIVTSEASIDAPITEVGTPGIPFCE